MEPDMAKTKLSQQTYLANRRVCSELAVTGGTYTQQRAHVTLAKIQADQTKHMRNYHPSPVMIPGHLVPVLFPYHDSLFSHVHVRFFFCQEGRSRCREEQRTNWQQISLATISRKKKKPPRRTRKTLATRWRMSSVYQFEQTLKRKGTARNPTSWTGTVQVWTSTKQSLWLVLVEILMRCNFCQKCKRLPMVLWRIWYLHNFGLNPELICDWLWRGSCIPQT